jgi:hypothetical protein
LLKYAEPIIPPLSRGPRDKKGAEALTTRDFGEVAVFGHLAVFGGQRRARGPSFRGSTGTTFIAAMMAGSKLWYA